MVRHDGRLELTWSDKDKALLSATDGKYDYQFADRTDPRVLEVRVLHEVERVAAPTPAERLDVLPQPTTDNFLITGDAHHVLDALRKTPEWADKVVGKVRCVYIDPPFNTGQTFAHYEDNIDHSIWLTMLRDRLKQLTPLLSKDGSIWVHLDDAEVHRCRLVLDEELGPDAFIAEVTWEKADSPNNSARYLSKDQDTILVYAKSKKTWRPNRLPRSAADDAHYANPDSDKRGRWYPGDPFANKPYSKGLYTITGPTGRTFKPPAGRYWRISEETFKRLDADERVYWGPDQSARPSIKRFLAEVEGLTPRTLWRHADVGSNRTSKNEMRALFPGEESFATPKPERLIQRVLQIATNPGDLVLDVFAGSGTTAAVAHKMGRRWITSELLPETVATFTKPRLTRVVNGQDLGGVTSVTDRVIAAGMDLPKDVTVGQAREFSTVLGRVLENPTVDADGELGAPPEPLTVDVVAALTSAVRAHLKANGGAITDEDATALLALLKSIKSTPLATVDVTRTIKRELTNRVKTRDDRTVLWHGGGGYTHLTVGPSMYDVDPDTRDIYLSDAAVNGDWSKSVAAQLRFTLTDDNPVFVGIRGRQRLAVIDGVADEVVVRTVVEHLSEKERTVIVAKVVLPDAEALLADLSPGSRLKKAPRALFPVRTVR